MEFGYHSQIQQFFGDALDRAFHREFGFDAGNPVRNYLLDLLARFSVGEDTFAPRNRFGQPVLDLRDMLREGDVTLNADSFEKERVVHRHIGDAVLFWSGMFPTAYRGVRFGTDVIVDPETQARMSYEIVSSFDQPPHDAEAPIFRELSDNFEAYQYGLRIVSKQIWAA